jgi:hypothetical protein
MEMVDTIMATVMHTIMDIAMKRSMTTGMKDTTMDQEAVMDMKIITVLQKFLHLANLYQLQLSNQLSMKNLNSET